MTSAGRTARQPAPDSVQHQVQAGVELVLVPVAGGRQLEHRPTKIRKDLDDGTLVIVGDEGGGRWFGGIDRQLRATVMSPFLRQKLVMLLNRENHEDIAELGRLATSGAIRAVVETYPLTEAAKALPHLEEGRVRGKVVLTV